MLTVKIITSNGESVRQALEVRMAIEPIPSVKQRTHDGTTRPVVYADLEGNSNITVESGTVYVMNDFGATVAKYELGGWCGPVSE